MAKTLEAGPIDEDEIQLIYEWVDQISLSRPKRNITRDFADGGNNYSVLLAEIVKHYFPTFVDIHNYSMAHSTRQKMYNWNTLNSINYSAKVFRKIGFQLSSRDIESVVNCVPDAVESVLKLVKIQVRDIQIERCMDKRPSSRTSEEMASFSKQEPRLFAKLPPKSES
jgi:hypothetical protein